MSQFNFKDVCSNLFNNYQGIMSNFQKIHIGGYPVNNDNTSRIIALEEMRHLLNHSDISEEHKEQIRDVLWKEESDRL